MSDGPSQPIIRGIQAVGSVNISYIYNSSDGKLPIPSTIKMGDLSEADAYISTSGGVSVAGFRLDAEFLRANPQIASSFVIPILGGGGVALTNNNRTGQLNLLCTKVSTPNPGKNYSTVKGTDGKEIKTLTADVGAMFTPASGAVGVRDGGTYFDMVTLAQIQQAQTAGDSVGATITISFSFCGLLTQMTFEGCTVASVEPIGLAGNNAPDYSVVFNYLNWVVNYSDTGTIYAAAQNSILVNSVPEPGNEATD